MNKFVVALDVGGTSIKAGLIDENLDLVNNDIRTFPSKSGQNAEDIINNMTDIICSVAGMPAAELAGVGFGFPGPFDYDRGISYITGLAKFESIYGMNVGDLIRDGLGCDVPVMFENDASVFGYGEYLKGAGRGSARGIYITLGTGLGSVFLDNGVRVAGKMGVPLSGMIYDAPFDGGMIEDVISRRGILNMARDKGFDEALDVRDIDVLARGGNADAQAVFREFGANLGKAIFPFTEKFQADALIIGGRISKGFDLFETPLRNALGTVKIVISDNLSKSALIGAANLIFKK